ncbi:tol-pal system-associated acyl-CoA thioesterase [Oxalicibacterium faecigallinarum]|nr:tol-pal system-associated acyl-CoA thioesterase [Oxalicibacterium faecigallinarum]
MSNFTWTIRVYYEDTDAGGVVFYANYLKFFERARTEWLRAAGIGQFEMTENHGVMFVVKSTALDYHAPARLDNELKLTVVVEKMGRASVQFVQEAWRLTRDAQGNQRQELLTTGRIKVGCVDAKRFRPAEIPAHVMDSIKALETP